MTAGFSPLALPSCFPFPPLATLGDGSLRPSLRKQPKKLGRATALRMRARTARRLEQTPRAGPQTQPGVSRFIGGSGGSQPPARTSLDAPHPTASIPCRARTRPELLTAAAQFAGARLKGSSVPRDTRRRRQADAKHHRPRQISSSPTPRVFLRAVSLASQTCFGGCDPSILSSLQL